MSIQCSLNHLKQKYRTRYYGKRGEDIPDLKPGDDAVCFVNNYLKIADDNSDSEDSICTRQSHSSKVAGHLKIGKNTENSQHSSTESCVEVHSKGNEHLMATTVPPAVPNCSKKIEKTAEISYEKLFSDEESDNEGTYVVAKLIEESLAEKNETVNGRVMNNSERPREKLYSSDTSVVQEPSSPTSNIHAKKWLSFKDATLAANNNIFGNVPRTSEEFDNNTQQLRWQECVDHNNPNITYDLHTGAIDNGSRPKEHFVNEDNFVIEEENSCNLGPWDLSLKKKKASPSSTKLNEDKPAPTPTKAISAEAPSSLKTKNETVKASRFSNATRERPEDNIVTEDNFVIEEENSCSSNTWIFPFKKKTAYPSSSKPNEDKPERTSSKAISTESPSSLKKKPENVKASRFSNATGERMVNEEKINNQNARKISFSDLFFKTATAGHTANRLSTVVSEATAPSTTVPEEEFVIEDLADINELKLLTIPIKAKSSQINCVDKKQKSVQHLLKTDKHVNDPGLEVMKATVPEVAEGMEVASSQDPEDVEDIASIHQDAGSPFVNLEENDSNHTVNANSNDMNQGQQLHYIRVTPRKMDDLCSENFLGDLDEKFSIQLRKGKSNVKSTDAVKNTKKSKQTEKKLEEGLEKEEKTKMNVAEMKTKKPSKLVKSSKANHKPESMRDYIPNDLEDEKILEASTTTRALLKRACKIEVKTDLKKRKERNVNGKPLHQSLYNENSDEAQTKIDESLQSKKNAKMKSISTPCPSANNEEGSVFESGPARQRALPLSEMAKAIICGLSFAELESGDNEILVYDDGCDEDEPSFSSEMESSDKEVSNDEDGDEDDTLSVISDKEEELLKLYSIVFDPDTMSDALVDCIAPSARSKFVGTDHCTNWHSFDNSIFTTGKLIIAPKKRSIMDVFRSSIMIYYVEQGEVLLNLYKSERILKNGDFFFVPPGNGCVITNLQDKEAVLIYNFLKMLPTVTQDFAGVA
ncbi:centromere protein C isoform X6 [Engystomops pustulosus]|uniref:centromere protein C isoform X6 n=1 Tax=Engystomops pustulosus TaxID=76066 RepID=UPI003AFB29A9